MDFVDYYKVLDLDKKATEKDIKTAYRKLARKYHPDLNPNDKEAHKKFQQINEANEVLSDPEKRKKYDQYGKDWKHAEQFEKAGYTGRPSGGNQFSGGQTYSGGFNENDFSDFFASMFGGAARNSGRAKQVKFKGQDYQAELQLPLREAYHTHKKVVTVNGKNIRITIPAGIENGQTIRIAGHGGPGMQGGPNGDLLITFVIPNDPKFKRSGNDLFTQIDIDLYTAVLGGEVMVETIDGKVKLQVKPGTQNGSKVKLKGKGFPVYKKDGEFGDLFVTYTIKIPTDLTQREKELFKELSKEAGKRQTK